MGIISDIFERSRETGLEPVDGLLGSGPRREKREEGPPLIECMACDFITYSEEDLKHHINEIHANRYIYLRVNDSVIHDYQYIDGDLKSLDVILLGYDKARIRLKIDANEVKEFDCSTGESLLEYLEGHSSGEIQLKAVLPSVEREFVIYWGDMYNFENSELDEAAFHNLFMPLNSKKSPNYRDFLKKHLSIISKKPEYRYAASLYDYAQGFEMSAHGDQGAKNHFECAFSGLRPFKTNFAITARRVLALRMNCFHFLESCEFPSRFAIANLFFNNPETRFNLRKSHVVCKDTSEYGVYIDDFTELFLEALSAYYSSDFRMLDSICKRLNALIAENDKNNIDKLHLLAARAAMKRSDSEEARRLYRGLRYHPFFKEEAAEMLECLKEII